MKNNKLHKSNWLKTNTFHHSQFKDIKKLVKLKEKKGLTISLCLPTLNEEKSIAKEIVIIKSELMERMPLLDEIVVIDSGSTDKTREIAAEYGADVYLADDILPNMVKYKGKGENLWKALYTLKGDIIVYLDADIKNIHHRFVYGLVAPLILRDDIKYNKAFYDRPLATDKNKETGIGGGRVTELVTRPLFSLFFPELTQIIQPLSGEYAGYRDILDKIPFPIGYGVETSMIIDIYKKWGLDVFGQVDLDSRVHRNQQTQSLGRMSFGILQTFFSRIQELGMMDISTDMFEQMIQYTRINDKYAPKTFDISSPERPAMISVPEYREKFNLKLPK